MDITSFLQSKWRSRRAIVSLLQNHAIQKNNELISYRKEPLTTDDTVTIDDHGTPVTYTVTSDDETYDIILFNKPVGCVVSKDDEHNQTIYELLPEWWKEKYTYIGRLDKDSHGLLVLTNALKLVSFFSHPRYNHEKVYHIQTDRNISEEDIQKWCDGVLYYDNDTREDIRLSWTSCVWDKVAKCYEIRIGEWKKRHIRRLCQSLWYSVTDLKTVQFWPWSLGDIAVWEWQIISSLSAWDLESLLANWNSYTQTQI